MLSRKFVWHGRQCEARFEKGLDAFPEAKRIRQQVFIDEQGFMNEFDETDLTAWHCVLYVDDSAAATGRLYNDESMPFAAHIGRLAVVKSERGSGLGSLMISLLEQFAVEQDIESISLSAQCRAERFYRMNGYVPEGEVYYDEHVEHIRMKKVLR